MSQQPFQRAYQKFWMGYEISNTKLRLFRFFFFAVFALDAWLQISHGARYGVDNFNVSHLPWLDGILPLPTRPMMVVVFGLQAYLGIRIALGAVSRASYIAAACLFAFGYYISQLNSLQHHHLLAMALCLLAAFPWPELDTTRQSHEPSPKQKIGQRERNWPVRMLLVSLSIMYFFAFVAKIDPLWLDGSTLKMEVSEAWMRDLCESLGWATVAKLTLAVELALAVALHIRRLWPLAIVTAVGMHMSFEFSGLDIGLFSYFMVSLYILLIPEAWLRKMQPLFTSLHRCISIVSTALPKKGTMLYLLLAVSLGVSVALLQLVPMVEATILTAGICVIALADALLSRRYPGAAIAHLLAVISLLGFLYTTNSVRDYYRYWGGREKRTGEISSATIRYEDLVRFEPSYAGGHRRLGDIYRVSKRNDEALAAYEEGLRLDPDDFSLNKSAAQLYHLFGRGSEALACAERSLSAKPGDQTTRRIRDHWKKKLNSNAP